VQERSRRRREQLLDAAARVLDRDGWDALTTTAIAREAGASVGAVYDYFGNRDSVLVALLERYEERLGAALDAALARAEADPVAAASAAVDALARQWLEEPGYRAAWLGTRAAVVLDGASARWTERFHARVAGLLAGLAPGRTERELAVVAWTAIHLVSGLLLAAVSAEPPEQNERNERDERIAEARTALLAYLAVRLGVGTG